MSKSLSDSADAIKLGIRQSGGTAGEDMDFEHPMATQSRALLNRNNEVVLDVANANSAADILAKLGGNPMATDSQAAAGTAEDVTVNPKQLGTITVGNLAKNAIKTNQQFVFVGDSITWGLASPNTITFPQVMALRSPLKGLGTFHNAGSPGSVIAGIVSRYSTEAYPYRPAATGASRSVLVIEIGANDFSDYSLDVAAWVTTLKSYIATAVTDGFEVYVCTIMDRATGTTPAIPPHQVRRLAMNAAIRALTLKDGVTAVIDLDRKFPTTSDTNFFIDGTHPTDNGNYAVADFVGSVILSGNQNPLQETTFNPFPRSDSGDAILFSAGINFPGGASAQATITNAPTIGTDPFTISGWVYFPNSTPGVPAVAPPSGLAFVLGNGAYGFYIANTSGGGKLFLGLNPPFGISTNGIIYSGSWQYVAVTRDAAGVVSAYLNGLLIQTATSGTGSLPQTTLLNGSSLKVSIARVRLYNRALTALEIKEESQRLSVPLEAELHGSQTAGSAGTYVVGRQYRIVSVGSTDFTAIGASSNTVGVEFTATGVGSGSGTATPLGLVYALGDAFSNSGYQISGLTDSLCNTSVPASGPKLIASGKRGRVVFTTTGTGNVQLLGQVSIPTNARITSWVINASGSTSVNLGNVSAGTQFASAASLSTGLNDVTLSARFSSTGNLWCVSTNSVTLVHTVSFELAD